MTSNLLTEFKSEEEYISFTTPILKEMEELDAFDENFRIIIGENEFDIKHMMQEIVLKTATGIKYISGYKAGLEALGKNPT